jgi:hypothetical protein
MACGSLRRPGAGAIECEDCRLLDEARMVRFNNRSRSSYTEFIYTLLISSSSKGVQWKSVSHRRKAEDVKKQRYVLK